MPDAAVQPLGDVLAGARRRLLDAGIEHAAREASRLWAAVSGGMPGAAARERERPVSDAEVSAFDAAVHRRAGGEPAAYVTGLGGFRFLELACDRRALIPRPETEGLVERVLDRAPAGRVADIGTGTGCIALSLALEGPYEQVLAVDRSGEALALARANAERQSARVALVEGDLVTALAQDCLDALVSNPPYLSADEYAALDPGVRDWEPMAALVSGADGMDATFRLLDEGRRVVKAGGWVALEVDCTRATAVARRASALGWRDVAVEADLFGRERYLLARRSAES